MESALPRGAISDVPRVGPNHIVQFYGNVSVESAGTGRGATFTVSVPVVRKRAEGVNRGAQ